MPSTTIYSIGLPTVNSNQGTWDELLNDLTFRSFDQYYRDNPSSYVAINASGTTASGTLRINNNINLPNNYWAITHSSSGTLDIGHNQVSALALTITSGGSLYRYSTVTPYTSYGPVGMYYPSLAYDEIGDWIAASTTTPTNVDVSDDGVPLNAIAAHIAFIGRSSASDIFLRVRKDGDATDAIQNSVAGLFATFSGATTFIVPILNGIFEAKFFNSWTATVNRAVVLGYFI